MTRFFPALLCALFFGSLPVHAEQANRDKPISLEADQMTIDDVKRIQTLEGNVVLTQGTLMIHASKIVMTEDAYGFQHGVAFAGAGGLARFRQKREGREEWIDGEAERIEYDAHNEVAELFHRAWIKSGSDQLRGDYIWYDAISERYLASAGAPDNKNPDAPKPRVRAVIQPKNKPVATTNTGAESDSNAASNVNPDGALRLKSTPALTPPEHP
ncbi:MAG: lipopolysaccharide transport periplasmic protein LptA [Zoogloeaceae bacterium]|jgi:lipopolysaccharide export system protein LptA|nr:lipopolysaccharide transport periplasmic protein LptA [Zoogloeaceae bacterium]